jgi:hypothetical protein
MLLPSFSIRALLLMLTLGAVAFLIVGMAFRGQHWAWGASVALFSVLVTAIVHAAWFGVIWLFVQKSSAPDKTANQTGER